MYFPIHLNIWKKTVLTSLIQTLWAQWKISMYYFLTFSEKPDKVNLNFSSKQD